MISKTIGFRGLAYFQTNPYISRWYQLVMFGQILGEWRGFFLGAEDKFGILWNSGNIPKIYMAKHMVRLRTSINWILKISHWVYIYSMFIHMDGFIHVQCHHHSSSFIIIHHHSLWFIIIHHHSSSFIIIYHHSSSFIIIHYYSSSFIIHHHSSSFIIIHHPLLYIYIYTIYTLRLFSGCSLHYDHGKVAMLSSTHCRRSQENRHLQGSVTGRHSSPVTLWWTNSN